jgi:hypothetical protein
LSTQNIKICFMCLIFTILLTFIIGVGFCATVVNVSTTTELINAVNATNSTGGNITIMLKDGIYTLNNTLCVNTSDVTIRSQSGIRENVVIQGDAMSSSAKVGNIFRVAGSNFEIRDLTIQKCGWHAIQIAGEENADNPKIINCILRDTYEQILTVSFDNNLSVASDNGLVENCLFEYSSGIGPQWYIGGVDALGTRNWIVRNNIFKAIISPSDSIAQFAIHFWRNSADNVVEKNLIINCDRGIGFGMEGNGNIGGIIRNNMIYHANNKGQFADTGISLTESPNSKIYNNTIFMEHDFPWAIEYRFSSTQGVFIANNLTNKPIISRDSAIGTITNNVTNAIRTWFVNASNGDLHLSSVVNEVVDAGQNINGLTDDFDGQIRPQMINIDIGADELINNGVPQAPRNLQIIH